MAFGSPSAMCGISQFVDSKINGRNPVKIGCVVSEKSDQKSVHTAYTVRSFTITVRQTCYADYSMMMLVRVKVTMIRDSICYKYPIRLFSTPDRKIEIGNMKCAKLSQPNVTHRSRNKIPALLNARLTIVASR